MRDLLKFVLIVIIMTFFVLMLMSVFQALSAFEIEKNEHWYYKADYANITLSMGLPDKMGHFYRSFIVTQFVDPRIVASGSLLYEYIDERRGVKFSYKDLIVDTIGIIAGKFYKNKRFKIFLDWKPSDQYLMLKIYYSIDNL